MTSRSEATSTDRSHLARTVTSPELDEMLTKNVVDASARNVAAEPATIVCAPLTGDLQAANCGAFAVRLMPGTSAAEAHAIARYLQVHVKGFCHLEA